MSKKKPNYDPKRNARIAWLAINAFGKSKTDADIIIELMAYFPGTSEHTAREDLKAIYQRFHDINQDNIEFAQSAALKQAWDLYEKCVKLCQMSAAVKLMEHIHKLMGLGFDKQNKSSPDNSGTPTPAPDLVRERITQLMKRKAVQEQAQEAGIDLKDLADKADIE